jgi:hypothetical protein
MRSTKRGITRWEHEHVVEAAQRRLDEKPVIGATSAALSA